jgi:hypothetical protein
LYAGWRSITNLEIQSKVQDIDGFKKMGKNWAGVCCLSKQQKSPGQGDMIEIAQNNRGGGQVVGNLYDCRVLADLCK